MFIDVCTYNGERDILDIRLNVLYPYVDKFIIVEFDETFSGKKKPKHLLKDWNKDWVKFLDKIDYAWIPKSEWSKYKDLAKSSPNTQYGKGAEHWVREFCQKESIKDCLTDLKGEDVVFVGDCDELWNPEQFKGFITPCKLKLRVYSYYLNNRSTEEFWGTIVGYYKDIKGKCLNHLRSTDLSRTQEEFGWHFTSMGGHENVKKKLTDSYTSDSYANDWVLNNLEQNINGNLDFIGRHFNYIQDESGWPSFIKNNKIKYKHLLRQ